MGSNCRSTIQSCYTVARTMEWKSKRKPFAEPRSAADVDRLIKEFRELFGRKATTDELSSLMYVREKLARHPELKWREQTQEWYCVKCGRTSDHVMETDAWKEIEVFDCAPPTPPIYDAPESDCHR